MSSLRIRLLLLAGLVTTLALVAAGLVITQLFTLHLERRVGQELETHVEQLAGGLRIAADGTLSLQREPLDPRFSRIFGGLYWQVVDTSTGTSLRSRSLWDASLPLATDLPPSGTSRVYGGLAPNGAPLLVHERALIVPRGADEDTVRFAVAIERNAIDALRAGFARDMAPALVVLGLVLLAGVGLIVLAAIRPFAGLRDAVGAVRRGETRRIAGVGPSEVAPLVEEVNSLLGWQERELERARDRAADLAHGLKTPLTAMAADVRRLREADQTAVADDLEAIATQMQRHVERELARSRIRHGGNQQRTAVVEVVAGVVRSLARTPDGERVSIDVAVADSLTVAMDAADLTEVVGNLLENACRHATARVRVTAAARPDATVLTVEDDGPGVPDAALAEIADRGRRLDMSGNGAGLGLAIVSDIVTAYGGELTFGPAGPGGLRVEVSVPAIAGTLR